MKTNHAIIVPETHWDREWYLPFQEYRARLVLMMDRLLEILRNDPDYKNFTLDGQVIPIEDYLEVRPQFEDEIKKYVKEGRLSIGPMYILPDEFLISGESMIRNLIIGHKLSLKFGGVMKAGYIPDPFGHIAQLPQILRGFEIPSVLFARGFGDEFEENELNMEFKWNSPGKAASIIGIHLVEGYGSVANMNVSKTKGKYSKALKTIKRTIRKLSKHTATPIALLNSGSDHHEARPEIPEIVKQWNEEFPDVKLEQDNFEYYVDKIIEADGELKEFEGELRGGKYNNLLSGVFSARMWIKQRNTKIEYLYEKFSEPLSTMVLALDKENRFIYPDGYLMTGYKWLIKNHPHDSICGCSIDEVHEDMKTRFDWAEQIGNEVFKDACVYISDLIKDKQHGSGQKKVIVFNPLPWNRRDVVNFNIAMGPTEAETYPQDLKIVDYEGNEMSYQSVKVEIPSRYNKGGMDAFMMSFIDELPACGYKIYYVIPNEKASTTATDEDSLNINSNSIENEFYKVEIDNSGHISCLDKETGVIYENVCKFEDVGDWGDEYDFSGPKEDQTDTAFTTSDAKNVQVSEYINGPTQKSLKISMDFLLPSGLSEDRASRREENEINHLELIISLYKGIKRVDINIKLDNQSKDHRIRALFPTNLKRDKVHADGHFYIIPRSVDLPDGKKWFQKPLPTNHQKDFIAVVEDSKCVGVINKGLPEYEAIKNEDKSITLAITLLRGNEWLSRFDLATRMGAAGPGFHAPGAQCLGKHEFELSFYTDSGVSSLLDSNIHRLGKEINCPLRLVSPLMVKTQFRMDDNLLVMPNIELVLGSTRFSEPKKEKILPGVLSFLEIDNDKIQLSMLKKAENGDDLIIRCYNLAGTTQTANLKITELLKIKNVKLVNLLEETPEHQLKAEISLDNKTIQLTLEPHVITSLRLEIE